MLITNAILGLLSFENLSGYDIKKKIQESKYLPWVGNNNQVYKALSELLEKELVTNENILQINAPAKKVYSITDLGIEQLKSYAKSEFTPMNLSKPFLLRLLSSKNLSKAEILEIIEIYRNQIKVDISKIENKQIDNSMNIDEFIFKHINLNQVSSLELELKWLEGLEKDLENVVFSKDKNNDMVSEKAYKYLRYELTNDYLFYSVKANGTNNIIHEKNIKDITIDVIENNCSHFVVESDVISKDSLNHEMLELLRFEFSKYNISFEII